MGLLPKLRQTFSKGLPLTVHGIKASLMYHFRFSCVSLIDYGRQVYYWKITENIRLCTPITRRHTDRESRHIDRVKTIIVLYSIVLSRIVLCCIALHCIALHCILLHCIVLHCIVLHCIVIIG